MRKDTRDRLVLPILIPVGALSFIAALVFGFSRVLLDVSAHAATATAVAVAFGILVVAGLIASLPKVRASSLAAMLGAVAGIAMLAGGIALAAFGPEAKTKPTTHVLVVALTAPKGAAINGYAQGTLDVPAGKPFAIAFDNQDTGVQHNVVITVQSDPSSTTLFDPAGTVTGPGKANYAVEPLKAATYYFHCAIHPTTMTGKIVAAPRPAGGGSPSGGPAPGTVAIDAVPTLRFNTNQLMLPTSGKVSVTFTNNDPGQTHNFSIWSANPADDSSARELVKTDPVTSGSTTVTFDALPPGSYHFQCDFHPAQMFGTVTVG